jgi:hypothetical protein
LESTLQGLGIGNGNYLALGDVDSGNKGQLKVVVEDVLCVWTASVTHHGAELVEATNFDIFLADFVAISVQNAANGHDLFFVKFRQAQDGPDKGNKVGPNGGVEVSLHSFFVVRFQF